MAKAEKTEIAQKETTELSLVVDFETDASGFEDMGQDDLALPFLRILTNMSPEIGSVDGASPGMIYNSVTGELHDGKAGVQVIPCAYVRQYIEWAPRGQGSGGPVNIFPATSDVLSRTHREPGDNKDYLDNGNYIENSAQHYVMVLDGDGSPSPALIIMKSTQLKKSRKWNSMMMSIKSQGKNGLNSLQAGFNSVPDTFGIQSTGRQQLAVLTVIYEGVWQADLKHRLADIPAVQEFRHRAARSAGNGVLFNRNQ